MVEVKNLSADALDAHLNYILASPKDVGTLDMLVVRRGVDQRESREEVYLSPEGGMEGDRWIWQAETDTEHAAQLTLMNTRILKLIADNDTERMALAGDNLVADFNLGEENVPAGTKLRLGEVLLEVTPQAHNGCKKFAARFGPEALKYINAVDRRHLHLRGIYVRVLEPGIVRIGDSLEKV